MPDVAVASEDPTLAQLLVEGRTFCCEFPPALSNHLPMVLVALARLGANPRRLTAFAEIYANTKGLVPAPAAATPIDPKAWRCDLGDRAREADYRAFFLDEATRLGPRAAITTYLPELVPGVAASALHPLMRLSYGVMRDDVAEIGTALGYWASTYLTLGSSENRPAVTTDPAEVLLRLRGLAELHDVDPNTDHLWHFMRAVAARPAFAPVIDWLALDARSLPALAAASLALFAATMDFCALHAVTGAHWIRMLTPVIPDPVPLMRYFWQAVASLYPRIGFPDLPTPDQLDAWRQQKVPDWPDIKAAAVASNDEHDHSLVFSAFEEWRTYSDPLYRFVAARRVGLA
jgi:hypothetical protein